MAKQNDIPLQKKVDVVINLLSLIGAEHVDMNKPSVLIEARNLHKELANAIKIATGYVIEYLEFIRTYLS